MMIEGLVTVCPANAPVPVSVICAVSPMFVAVWLPVCACVAVVGTIFLNVIVNGEPL